MTTIDINTAMLVGAAGCFGIVIGIALAALIYRKRLAALGLRSHRAEAFIQKSDNHVLALLAAGAGLTQAIADLRARKQAIGGTVDAAVNAWTAARIDAETPY